MVMVYLEVITTVLHNQHVSLLWEHLVQVNASMFLVPAAHWWSIAALSLVASDHCFVF